MYWIRGVDRREYGPVPAETVRQWIAEGRANPSTETRLDSTADWKPLSEFPEFAEELSRKWAGAPADPSAQSADQMAQEILNGVTEVRVIHCFGRAWDLVTANFWRVVGVSCIFLLLMMALKSTGLGLLLLNDVLFGGYLWYLWKLRRGEPTDLGDMFRAMGDHFLPLMIVGLVAGLLVMAGFILCIIPGIYLTVVWMLAVPLILDRKLDFWKAMEVSRKIVHHYWFSFFLICLLGFLLNIVGTLACLVGVLVTTPVSAAALIFAYEEMTGPPRRPTGDAA